MSKGTREEFIEREKRARGRGFTLYFSFGEKGDFHIGRIGRAIGIWIWRFCLVAIPADIESYFVPDRMVLELIVQKHPEIVKEMMEEVFDKIEKEKQNGRK